MPAPAELTGPANAQVLLGDVKPIGALVEHLEPLAPIVGERLRVHEDAVRLRLSSPDSPAKLVERREPKRLRVLDHDARRVGDVDAYLDDARGDEDVDLPAGKSLHRRRPFRLVEARVRHPYADRREVARELPVHLLRATEAARTTLIDSRVHEVRLVPRLYLASDKRIDLGVVAHARQVRLHRLAPRRQGVDRTHLAVPKRRQREGARDRRRAHHEHVGGGPARQEPLTLLDAELVLLVDDRESEVGPREIVGEERVRSDHQVERAVGERRRKLAPRGRGHRSGRERRVNPRVAQ